MSNGFSQASRLRIVAVLAALSCCLAGGRPAAAGEVPCSGTDFPCALDIPDYSFQRVPPVFQFQTRIAQVKLPSGDAVFEGVTVKLSSGGKVICTEKIPGIIIKNNVLNLTIGQNIDCELDEVLAENPSLMFQVCLGGDGACLKPVELAATPYALKTTYASYAIDASRADVAGQAVWTQRATADREMFLRNEFGAGYFDFYTHVEQDTAAIFEPGKYDEEKYPWKFENYAGGGFFQWTPVRDPSSLRVHILAKDPGFTKDGEVGKIAPLHELVLAAKKTTFRGDLTVQPDPAGNGLVVTSNGMHVKGDSVFAGLLGAGQEFTVEGGLLVSGDLYVDKHLTVGKGLTVASDGIHLLVDASLAGDLGIVGGLESKGPMDSDLTTDIAGLLTAGALDVTSTLTIEGTATVGTAGAANLGADGLLKTATLSGTSNAMLEGDLSVTGTMQVALPTMFHGHVTFVGGQSNLDPNPDLRYVQAENEARALTFGGLLTFAGGAELGADLDMSGNLLKKFRFPVAAAAPLPCDAGSAGYLYFDTVQDTLLICSAGQYRDLAAPATQCGNYYVEQGEACDDGNNAANDGCAANCTVEAGWICTPTSTQPSVCSLDVKKCDGVVCPKMAGHSIQCNLCKKCEYIPDNPFDWHGWSVWIWIPAGSFQMGSPDTETGALNHEKPQHTVTFNKGYWIAKFELVRIQYEACMSAGKCTDASEDGEASKGWNVNTTANGRGWHPANAIQWHQARDACAFITEGGRLATEAEWEYAASGPTHRMYPWGDSPAPSCAPQNAVFDEDGPMVRPWSCNPCTNWGCSGTMPADSAYNTASAWSCAQGMAGNVWEWCEDWWHSSYDGAPVNGSSWLYPNYGKRVIRGGSFQNNAFELRTAYRHYEGLDASSSLANTGGRCVKPAP